MPHLIRLATEDDAEAMAAIYAPVVRETAISFELVPPDADAFRARIREFLKLAPCLVLEDGRGVAGYAYASSFRARAAYRFTVETSAEARGRFSLRDCYEITRLFSRPGRCKGRGSRVHASTQVQAAVAAP